MRRKVLTPASVAVFIVVVSLLMVLSCPGCGSGELAKGYSAGTKASIATSGAGKGIMEAAPPGRRPGSRPGGRSPVEVGSGDKSESPETEDVEEPELQVAPEETSPEGEQGEDEREEEVPDLIIEAGFDMIYPNFNRETGRRDPFVPVSAMDADWEPLKKIAGEKFRVIGTAMTPSGQIAMINVMEQTKIIREGDVMENGSVVKTISPYDVVLDKDGRELRLTMFTRRRVATQPTDEEAFKLKDMDNINDLYKKYLEEKFGEETEGEEGESMRPRTFNDYLDQSRPGGEPRSGGEF